MTERTLMQKIQRILPESERLHKMSPNSRWYGEYGPYYVVETEFNMLVAWGIDDLIKLHKEVCLSPLGTH